MGRILGHRHVQRRSSRSRRSRPDWVAVTLNAYRSRFLAGEPRDPRYDAPPQGLAEAEKIGTLTLMIQGADDRCDEPPGSAHQERFFTLGHSRVVLDRVGQLPHREAPD